ncbi:glycoside hydrolase 5 family protein [Chondrinema litorale]|uniref:glycoside hydrolase 5 family protein n=1 Tax=Chondrinema litorale TaxID=2994555 RepID=UPI0025437153|nr:beta-mannosidase [Chondrinema litorale]UZR92699.1 beta-mannosidase [Chondrinema litorale]
MKFTLLGLTTSYLFLLTMGITSAQSFIKINNQKFIKNNRPYYFIGTNFWYGMNLGAEQSGDRERLIRELDHLKKLGINNLRIMAGSEGPDTEPWRMTPSLQPELGIYNKDLLQGLDYLLDEMRKREMYAVVCLNNFWPWSGGMAQYVNWYENSEIPYPPPAEGGSWSKYQFYTARFYKDKNAIEAFNKHIKKIVGRVNSYTKIAYKDDPTIMAWQLANEPRGILSKKAFNKWIDKTTGLIKSLDKNHLVTVGSEGKTHTTFSGNQVKKNHNSKHVDYMTIHVWAQNWEWFNPEKADETLILSKDKAEKYIEKHIEFAKKLKMPLVLEEFGISRDLNDHSTEAPVSVRDEYYEFIFSKVIELAKAGTPLAGCNFWAWGGEGRPSTPKAIWKNGDDFIGDPPHEYQGWYSVYNTDESTIEVIKTATEKINQVK